MGRMVAGQGLDGATFQEAYWDNPVHFLPEFPWLGGGFGQPLAREGAIPVEEAAVPGAGTIPPCLHVVIQCAGPGRVACAQWETLLATGDVALYVDTDSCPAAPGQGQQMSMGFPLLDLTSAQREVIQHLPTVLPGGHPATALLAQVADCVNQAAGELPPFYAQHFLGGLLTMLAGILEAHVLAAGQPKLTHFHLQRIKAYLRQHLREPDLSVKRVAHALGLSVSHVHRIFAHEGCTVSDWLWGERLEGCATDLVRASEAHRTLGEIALAWGFNDLSHFSRTFKKRYGVAPKVWRAQAAWRRPLLGRET